jgi:hypothetical protein
MSYSAQFFLTVLGFELELALARQALYPFTHSTSYSAQNFVKNVDFSLSFFDTSQCFCHFN